MRVFLLFFGVLLAACASDDPSLERRGGPAPEGPVDDPVVESEGGAAGAGGSPDAAPGPGGAGTDAPIAFCEAYAVLAAKCQRCHQDPTVNGAPVPFLTYEDTQAQYYDTTLKWSDVMVGVVERDFMPYVALNGSPSLVGGTVEPLTPDEKATLLGWLGEGALPEGGTDCSP